MTWRQAWNDFWFAPRDLRSVGRFRIALGLVVLMKLGLLVPVLDDFFSETGMLTLAQSRMKVPAPRLCLFDYLPVDCAPVFLGAMLVIAALFTVGWRTRLMSLLLYLGMASIDQRNWLILNSGDRLLTILLFFGMFAPLGATYSLDGLSARRRGRLPSGPVQGAYWAVRLMQIQICLMYFWSTFYKIRGEVWASGEALYWVLRNLERVRWPLPSVLSDTMLGVNFLTYGTLLVEMLFPVLVWPARTRALMLACGLVLHLGMEYALTIGIFQYVVLASYLLFLERN